MNKEIRKNELKKKDMNKREQKEGLFILVVVAVNINKSLKCRK